MPLDLRTLALLLSAFVLAVFAVFAIWPGVDLFVSGLFDVPGVGFPLEDMLWPDRVRRAIWGASIAMVVIALAGLLISALRQAPLARLPVRDWGFIVALYLFGPGLLVEATLKPLWGRARPANIVEFGGTRQFTALNDISDQCLINCSFTSGEVAGAVALAISLGVILSHWRTGISRGTEGCAWVAIIALPVLVGVQRVAAGRHFLSDVLLSALGVGLVAVGLAALLRLQRPR